MVATVAFWPAAARVFESKPFAWLGSISFSLYLVQAPIVIGVGLLFSDQPWWIGATLTLTTCFAIALLMYKLVEQPSTRLASWVGTWATRAWGVAIPKALTDSRSAAAEVPSQPSR